MEYEKCKFQAWKSFGKVKKKTQKVLGKVMEKYWL